MTITRTHCIKELNDGSHNYGIIVKINNHPLNSIDQEIQFVTTFKNNPNFLSLHLCKVKLNRDRVHTEPLGLHRET